MKKFVLVLMLFGTIIFGLTKVKEFYYEKENEKVNDNNNQIEEKAIDKVSVNNIINNINTNLATKVMSDPSYKVPTVITDLSLISVRGDKPDSINFEIKNMQVYKGEIIYKGITYYYENDQIIVKE